MLYKIRKNVKSLFFRIILIGVALTFISWGAGYFSRGNKAVETEVIDTEEGLPITLAENQGANSQTLHT